MVPLPFKLLKDCGQRAKPTVTKEVIFDTAPVPSRLSHYTGSFPDADVDAPRPLKGEG